MSAGNGGPHAGQPVLRAGAALEDAKAAAILVHGRGTTAAGMLSLADVLDIPGIAYLAPQAAGQTWYPYSFLEEVARNEPGRSSGLARIGGLLDQFERQGIPRKRAALIGFSQGACLALEYAARAPTRCGAVAGLSGGLIGARIDPESYSGDLAGMLVFLGCSDVDPHIPLSRVRESAEIFRRLGADVTERIYPGMGHTINEDEIAHLKALLTRLVT